jgi:hypothetical protein
MNLLAVLTHEDLISTCAIFRVQHTRCDLSVELGLQLDYIDGFEV